MRRKTPIVLLAGLLAVVAAGCSGGGSLGLGPTTPTVRIGEVEQSSFSLVNTERDAVETIDLLAREAAVAQLAREFSEQMRDERFFGHTSPDGVSLLQRLNAAGIEFRSAAENLAKVTNSADPASFAHSLLLQQPHHRDNMLEARYELLGVGAATDGDTVWITQIYVEQ